MTYALQPGERGVCIGQSGCGKSTLATDLVRRFLHEHPKARALIIDSKPRYRATHKANGTRSNYRRWAKGDVIDGSIAIHHPSELANAYKFTRCAILQSVKESGDDVEHFEEHAAESARRLFRSSWVG